MWRSIRVFADNTRPPGLSAVPSLFRLPNQPAPNNAISSSRGYVPGIWINTWLDKPKANGQYGSPLVTILIISQFLFHYICNVLPTTFWKTYLNEKDIPRYLYPAIPYRILKNATKSLIKFYFFQHSFLSHFRSPTAPAFEALFG